ncbi:MAG TPA: ABC transporter permease [Acidimicrobiia bacterium]|jgi:ABC-2 type transport system permease protein/oleandomycin transport system permease protein
MTATAATLPAPTGSSVSYARPRVVGDSLTIAWRNLLNIRRNPQLLVFATIQPVIFVLMFRYVFGGAIKVPGVSYVDYLMPGIFVQTVVFGSLTTGVGLAEDLQKGLVDRFRSLPMARSAVLIGRTLADLVRNVFVVALMCIVGLLVGWNPSASLPAILAGLGLVLAFSYSLSWLFAIVGLAVRNGETAQAASFPLLAPLVFASSAFVPVASMPDWLQVFAKHQPVSVVVNAVRGLTLGSATTSTVLSALAWIVGLVAVFAPIAVARYRRAV